MALIDKASLLFVPSVVAQEKAFNILPSGNRAPDSTDQNSGYDQTRADFTFDRGSNAAATRIGSDGLIKKYRENLLLQSNQFDTTWVNVSTTETGGQADKDGGSTAWKLENTATAGRIQQGTFSSGVKTMSVYAHAGNVNWIQLYADETTTANDPTCYFDLQNGVVGTSTYIIDKSIESVGGGWYRCIMTFNAVGTFNYLIFNSQDDNVRANSGEFTYIQNAQLESGLVATDVLTSGATTAKAGVLIDLPRINYDANGENGSLLLEPSRKNNIPYSEWFGIGSGWSYFNNVSVGNFVLSPEGKMNATELIFDGTTSGRLERAINGLTSGADYSVSLYARVASGTQNVFFGSYQAEVFTLTTEWQRLEKTQPENDTTAYPRITCDDAATIEIYGFQHEAGSYATSYIPNHGESGGVTRAVDDASVSDLQNLNVFNGSQGAVLFEGVKNGETIFSNFVVTANSNTNKSLLIDNSSGAIRLRVWNASSGIDATISTSSVDDGAFKYLIKWNAGSLAVYFNGSSVGTDTITAYSYTNVNLKEGTFSNNYIKQFTLFDEVPTDAECITLTTL